MSFKFMKLVVDWDGVKYNNRLELGDESDTPVDLRFKVPGYIENVHTVFFQNYSSETNVPRIYGDTTNLVFYDNHDATNQAGVKLADIVSGMGESLWESSIDGETYLTTPEHINLKGYALRGSNVTGGNLLLVANSIDVGKILCNDMLDVQNNDIVNINSINGRDTADLVFYGATQTQNGTDEFMRWKWDGQKLVMNNTLDMGGNGITNVGGITMSDAINMGGNGISNAYVIKANGTSGVEFRPYNYAASGDELLNIAWNGLAFVAGANASMDGNDLSYVKAINGTTTTSLQLNFCGNDPATHEIWRVGDDIKFKDVHTGTKTLSELAAGGGSSTFIGLSDTPPNYTDATGKFVKVSDANTLEFVAGSGSFICTDLNSCHVTDLTDVSSAGSGSIITDVERTKLNGINTSDFLLIDGTNHMTGALNFTNGSYVGKIELDASGNLMLFRGLNTSTEAMRFASEENIMYANLNMSGAKITGIGAGTAASHDAARMVDLDAYMLTATYVGGDGVIDIPVGGTGISTFAQGDILYASDVNTLAALGKGTATQVLTMNTTGTLPEWATGSSSSAFIGLSDTPPDYTGAAGKYVRVNSAPDGLEFVAGSGGGVTDHALLTNLDYAHADHTGFAPTSHAHAWADITSGVPAYCTRWPSWTEVSSKPSTATRWPSWGEVTSKPSTATRWPAWSEVSSKPSLLYTDGSNHMTGDLNFWNGSYRGAIDLDASGNLIFSRGLNSPTTAMMFASEENIMYANLNMGGNAIDDAGVIKANATTGIDCCYSGGTTMLYIATSSYAFVANANASMNTHNIVNVGGITMSGNINMGGHDITSCPNIEAAGTTGYMQVAGGSSHPAAMVAYGEDHTDFPGDVRLYVPNAAKSMWMVGLIVNGATDSPNVQIPYGLDMNNTGKITSLVAGTESGEAVERGQLDSYLPLAGGSGSSMSGDLYMGGHHIYDVFNFYIHAGGTWDYLNIYNPAGDKLLVQLMSYGTIVASLNLPGADLNLNGNDINAVDTINGASDANLSFHDDILNDTVTLSQLAAGGGAGLWQDEGTYVQLIAADNDVSIRNKKIINLLAGTESGEAVERGQLDSYLLLSGGTLSGILNLGGQVLRGSAASGGNLTLVANSTATSGKIQCNDILDVQQNEIQEVTAIRAHSGSDIAFKVSSGSYVTFTVV